MSRLALACLWIFLGPVPLYAQSEVKWVTFLSQPTSQVVLEVSSQQPYLLGETNRPLALEMKFFPAGDKVSVTFRRDGWFDQTRVLQEAGTRTRYFDTYDRYPDPSQGAVVLQPRGDLRSRWLQIQDFVTENRALLVACALPLLGMAFWLGMHWRRLQRQAARARQLDSLGASQEIRGATLKVMGGYRLLHPLGKGGMATVYRAVPESTLDEKESVAIKLLHADLLESSEHNKRMLREVKVLCSLSHPNLVRILNWGEEGEHLYLVMELLEGKTFERLRQDYPKGMPADLAASYILPVAEGVQHAHDKGIVHRDLKPENLFLTDSGRVKVMDFGIARGANFTRATATGVVTGTPTYIAPEQLGGKIDPQSDQYALGVVLFLLLTGELPFDDPDPFLVVLMHQSNLPPSPRQLRPELSAAVEAVVLRMLEKRPERRYPSILEAAREFQAAATMESAGGR